MSQPFVFGGKMKIQVNHRHGHDIYELVRLFYPDKEIQVSQKEGDLASILGSDLALASLTGGKSLTLDLAEYEIYKVLSKWESKLLKTSVYRLLRDETGKEFPWGMLTGVRPGKLARSIGDLGYGVEPILRDYFFLDKDKAELMAYLYGVQGPIIDKYKTGYSLYINIPFCPSICSYCSYSVLPIRRYENHVGPYVDKLLEELDFVFENYGSPSMAYIGGGTPSAIDTRLLEKIVDRVLGQTGPDEFTVELGREDTINRDLLTMLRGRVDRICINPQSMADKTAQRIGRSQSSRGIIEAYHMARDYGFSINMDTIVGLPGEGREDVEETFDQILDLGPDNITVHSLAMKKNSKLTRKGFESEADMGQMIDLVRTKLAGRAYKPYYLYRQKDILGNFENIGYAKDGKICSYNVVSMEETQTIIGLGMGAVSKYIDGDRPIRKANFKSLKAYMDRFDEVLKEKEPRSLGE